MQQRIAWPPCVATHSCPLLCIAPAGTLAPFTQQVTPLQRTKQVPIGGHLSAVNTLCSSRTPGASMCTPLYQVGFSDLFAVASMLVVVVYLLSGILWSFQEAVCSKERRQLVQISHSI